MAITSTTNLGVEEVVLEREVEGGKGEEEDARDEAQQTSPPSTGCVSWLLHVHGPFLCTWWVFGDLLHRVYSILINYKFYNFARLLPFTVL